MKLGLIISCSLFAAERAANFTPMNSTDYSYNMQYISGAGISSNLITLFISRGESRFVQQSVPIQGFSTGGAALPY